MKISKLFANTLQSKTGLIFFAVLTVYNLMLGFYLRDYFVLSPMLLTFYLLSALPTLFFVIRIRSTSMRAIVYVVLIFVLGMSLAVFVCASRKLTFADLFEFLSTHIIYENIWSRFKKTLFSRLQTAAV